MKRGVLISRQKMCLFEAHSGPYVTKTSAFYGRNEGAAARLLSAAQTPRPTPRKQRLPVNHGQLDANADEQGAQPALAPLRQLPTPFEPARQLATQHHDCT